MPGILEFISLFQSESNKKLFTETACYYFAMIILERYPTAELVYNPDRVHFAAKIFDGVYDITGLVEDGEDYINWYQYSITHDDAAMIYNNCRNI